MLKNKNRFQKSSYTILASVFGLIVYSTAYTTLDLTIRFNLLDRGLYTLSLIPIALFSIGIAYGMVQNLTNNRLNIFFASLLLGFILFAICGYLFYVLDGFIIYTRY
jgi:hypothetical protein